MAYLVENNRGELYNLSNQMIEIFVNDIFSKDKTELERAKLNISDEQREALKQSVNKLKSQVEDFIFEQKTLKTVTEDDHTNNSEPISPLREKLSIKSNTTDSIDSKKE